MYQDQYEKTLTTAFKFNIFRTGKLCLVTAIFELSTTEFEANQRIFMFTS